ncbi:F-box/LRR-repeat protein 6 [Cyprinodon tularosa]|uniref:F-box/LRR-repeat protein 6 n=1 Tax=Cyprinodon tularosa TaxID=77115 RepID=UPI0018E261A0|nr:F-box/LRR-repeat protein 6 [Cyprinodon tularosa]XP_038126674.1 F-box/LRR-repeat protein 6 [Cyprinodon tularosa]
MEEFDYNSSVQPGGSRVDSASGASGSGKTTPRKERLKSNVAVKAKKAKKTPPFHFQQPTFNGPGEDIVFFGIDDSTDSDDVPWSEDSEIVSKAKSPKKKKSVSQEKPPLKRKPVKKKPPVVSPDQEKEREKPPVHAAESEDRWGQHLPEEVLVYIFQMVAAEDGAVPFLCRVGRVCRLWNAAASTPILWRKVTVGYCWYQPAKKLFAKTRDRIKETVAWLTENRFSQLRDFTLCHWAKNVDFTLESISKFCPHLHSLHLSYCKGLTASGMHSLGLHSRSLQTINLQHSQFQIDAVVQYLEEHGNQIRQMLFTRSSRHDKLLSAISRGCCPNLELLDINNSVASKDTDMCVCFKMLQHSCPKLKIFRMMNIQITEKVNRKIDESECGFPLLDEFCVTNAAHSYMTDEVLLDTLFGSTKLRVLDLRGAKRITAGGLAELPSQELECLFWGVYFTNPYGIKDNLHLLIEKWGHTLRQLDITNQPFTEADLEGSLRLLSQLSDANTLVSLNLTGTKVTAKALRPVVERLTGLNYLNLTSCRNLPRGMKKIYRSQGEIRELLVKLH